ncbi:MAG: class I SAM-dependent methyltransferase [Dehalococcoidia bacterium]
MAVRSAREAAEFLIPHLQRGMQVLDCGCGPGTITLGLAEIVAPGEVLGVDHEPAQVERARALAAERGVPNVRFEVGDLFALPYPAASFDAVFAHAVLMHVPDRLAALREFHRVLRPGGVVAVKDIKTDGQIMEPSAPLLREFLKLLDRARRHNGVSTSAPQKYRALLRAAGFVDVEATASCMSYGTSEAVRHIAAFPLSLAQGAAFQRIVREQGWADQSRLDAICAAIAVWGELPDAFRVELWCSAVGRSPI